MKLFFIVLGLTWSCLFGASIGMIFREITNPWWWVSTIVCFLVLLGGFKLSELYEGE